MKLNEFIFNVLEDINSALNQATEKHDKDYAISKENGGGVSFDIAVTTTNSKGSQVEGKAKAGIIEVIGAGIGGKLEDKSENSEVSRIQFTVHVPPITQTQRSKQLDDTYNAIERNKNEYRF